MSERRPGTRHFVQPTEPDGVADPPATNPPYTLVRRPGRGSLASRITAANDWDSTETNEQIAADFGLLR
jgi:hypothetical protein